MNRPARLAAGRFGALTATLAVSLAAPAWAQLSTANPLLRPNPPQARTESSATSPPPLPRSAAERSGVPPGSAAGLAQVPRGEGDEVPSAVLERVASLYVAAIVDSSAVLRSQLAVAQPGIGGAGLGAASGVPGQTATMGGQGTALGSSSAPAAASNFRAASYVVHDSQPIRLFDNYRLLPRVDDTGVVLYLLPPSSRRGEIPRVVFRGLLTSVIGAPYVPARSLLETPDGGLDGKARRELVNVDRRAGSSSGASGTGADGRTGTGAQGSGNTSTNTSR